MVRWVLIRARLWIASLIVICGSLISQIRPVPDPLRICGFTPPPLAHPNDPQALTITVWSQGAQQECTRPYLPAIAAPLVKDYRLNVESRLFASGPTIYEQAIAESAAAQQLPDILGIGENKLQMLLLRNIATPLDDCIATHPDFRRIRPDLWQQTQSNGHVMGIPYSISYSALFFNKRKLRALGWSDARIAALPDDIRTGKFTLQDMLSVAKQAVRASVVAPGFGIWSMEAWNPGVTALPFFNSFDVFTRETGTTRMVIHRDVLDQSLAYFHSLQTSGVRSALFAGPDVVGDWNKVNNLRDAAVEDRVLFWIDRSDEHGQWAIDKARDRGGFGFVDEHIGMALIPSAYEGRAGSVLSVFTDIFVISTAQTSGRNNQAAACALLAKMVSADVMAPGLLFDSATPLITSEHAAGSPVRFYALLQDYRHEQYISLPWPEFNDILSDSILELETGGQLVDVASHLIDHLRAAGGNGVTVQ